MRIIARLFSGLIGTLAILSLTACPSKPSKRSGAVKRVKGDPYVFVQNSAFNDGLPIPTDVIRHNSGWQLDLNGFIEGSAESNFDEQVKTQDPANIQASSGLSTGLVASVAGEELSFSGLHQSEPVDIRFSQTPQGWVLKRFKIGKDGGDLNAVFSVLHSSVAKDLSAFNVLLHHKKAGRRMVVGATFVRHSPLHMRIGQKVYNYLFGAGQKVGWKKSEPLVLHICEQPPEPLTGWVKKSVNAWNEALGPRLKFSAIETPRCPPFSDLNTRTFTYVNGWIEIAGEAAVAGQTLYLSGEGRKDMLDADIFILMSEFQEALDLRGKGEKILSPTVLAEMEPVIYDTVLHEIGHLLGLHHQFDPSIKSIMSYGETRSVLEDYDRKAIQHLYDE